MNQLIPSTTVASLLDHVSVPCPFDYLGLHTHPSGEGFLIRVWQPTAIDVEVIEQPSGKLLGQMNQISEGVFELHLPKRRKKLYYSINLFRMDGLEESFFDPYQFGEYVLKQKNIEAFALYRHIGSVPHSHNLNKKVSVDGVLFKVYAPNASSVSVVGDFNQWDGRIHPMASADDGFWRLFVPAAQAGSLYKFGIYDDKGERLPLKSDPFARFNEQWPGLASIVHAPDHYIWKDNSWMNARNSEPTSPMTVYEIHPGSWKKNRDGSPLNYRELADELIPYVLKMGFSHIQLMPISEHPDYESWGYQPVGLFAPTSRYGTPDDLKYLIDLSHQAGIGIILDWVPAQFPADSHGLANFDGTALFEHPDTVRGWHPQWQTHIYNYGSSWVQNFLISNALFWLDEFHIDGLRIDAVSSMLYLDYSREEGQWTPNFHGGKENIEAIHFLQRLNEVICNFFPGCITIAEEATNWPKVTKPVANGGLGFTYQWNHSWLQDTLNYMRLQPDQRKFHHNQLILSTVYSHNENYILPVTHETAAYGHGSLITQMSGNESDKFSALRAYFGYLFTHPGKKSLFMGSELASFNEWSIHQSLEWGLVAREGQHQSFQKLVGDLNKLYRSEPSLHELDQQKEGFSWLVMDDHAESLFAFARYDRSGVPVLTVCNMALNPQNNYRLGVPKKGSCQTLLNTDDTAYGGSSLTNLSVKSESVPIHGFRDSILLNLPPLSTLILSLKK